MDLISEALALIAKRIETKLRETLSPDATAVCELFDHFGEIGIAAGVPTRLADGPFRHAIRMGTARPNQAHLLPQSVVDDLARDLASGIRLGIDKAIARGEQARFVLDGLVAA